MESTNRHFRIKVGIRMRDGFLEAQSSAGVEKESPKGLLVWQRAIGIEW